MSVFSDVAMHILISTIILSNGCFLIDPVTSPRPVVFDGKLLYRPRLYSNSPSNTTGLGLVTGSIRLAEDL